mmetsp:Transcript_11344/g.16326  ORF Transcript_11344/g.16326 Transcript_11344/m.16326 type:complete len:119 (-) Transcript_11344:89-445(-)
MLEGLNWWLLGTVAATCPKAPGFGSVHRPQVAATAAYVDQTSLGWGQMLHGRLSKLWGDAYVQDFAGCDTKATHLRWTKGVIKALWKLAFVLWEHRNNVLHGSTEAEQAQLRSKKRII